MRFLELGKRNLKELYRDPIALCFLLFMPLAFILIFGWAFGEEIKPPIGVLQEDESPQARAFIEALKNVESDLRLITYSSEEVALKDVKAGKLTSLLIIPKEFGSAIEKGFPVPLEVFYDPNDPMAALGLSIIEKAALSFLGIRIPLALEAREAVVEVENKFMNFFVPGITVFGLTILVLIIAGLIVKDKERGFLQRLLTLPFTPSDFIFGYSLPFLPIIAVQVLIYIGVGMPMGLKVVGSFWLAFLIFFLIGLNCLAMGLIFGSLLASEEQTRTVPWLFLVPLVLLSGAFFSVDMMPEILTNIMRALPFLHALEASRSVITAGSTLEDILTDLYWLIGWAIVLFAAGIILFRRKIS